ncbi:MAG: ribonuclease Z [Nanoarchaeota archaeon]|nr:ribonuclease Z [Nanoarchaeota archaeon]MBU4124110.1 ribonuclease Z [Nanoarchaeota archaeon]
MPEPIEITFLGTGAAVPTIRRNHSAIVLHYTGEYILFDCGEGTQLQLQKAKISPLKISKIFITHWHADHFAGLLPLIETLHLEKRTEPLEIYGPEASRFVDAIIELSYWGTGFDIIAKDVESNQKIFENDLFEISTIKTRHSVPSVGYCFKEKDHVHIDIGKANKFGLRGIDIRKIKEDGKIKIGDKIIKLEDVSKITPGRKIIYTGDTRICPEIFKAAKNIDLLIHEGTFIERFEEREHSSAKEVARLAKKNNVKKLILTHFSKRYKTSKEIEKVVKLIFSKAIVAQDLMKVKI